MPCPSKGIPIILPVCVLSWKRSPRIILLTQDPLLVVAGLPGSYMVISDVQVPFDLASIFCISPGVAYIIQFFMAVAESTGAAGSSVFVAVVLAVVSLSDFAGSSFLS